MNSHEMPEKVVIYGGDHSPWVQAVLLGLHLKGIQYTLVSFPPPKVFAHSGVLMPAALLDDGTWLLQSQDILQHYGYGRLDPSDVRDVARTLRGGVHRIDSTFRFWRLWSWVRDEQPSAFARLRSFLLRPFLVLYFNIALHKLGITPKTSPTADEIGAAYETWQDKLAETPGPFLDGMDPGLRDIYLFAGIQLHASMPVPPLEVLIDRPELADLRGWISAMEDRCEGYRHLYSQPYFHASVETAASGPTRSTPLERCAFWLGSTLTLAAAPITVPLALYKLGQVRERGFLTKPTRI